MKLFWSACFCALIYTLPAQASLPLTPFELAPQKPLPKAAVVSGYLRTLAQDSPLARMTQLGVSAGGRSIDALLVSEDLPFLSTNSRAKDKPTVMLLGSQHGNEPSGTEVLQILARRLLDGDLRPLVSRMNFVVVALANPDGRDMNRRLNAKDENPNLDFIAVESPETRIYIDALARFKPDVVMDLHETWNDKYPLTPIEGFKTTTDAQFEVGNNPNLDANLSDYANEQYLPRLIERVSRAGVPAQRYNEIYSLRDPVRRGGLSLSNFRNYAAMQGALTVLFENRHDSLGKYPTPMNIAERVRKQLLSVEQALILVDQDRQHIQQLTRQASQQWEGQEGEERYVLQYRFTPNQDQPKVPVTLTDSKGLEVVKRFRLEDQVAINGIGEIPAGYVIRSQTKRFKSWLDRHHIDYQVVVGKERLTLQQQRVAGLAIAAQTNPGTRDWLDVTLDEKLVAAELKPGDIKISTDQPQGALIAIMLDPRSSNSLYQEPSWRSLLLSNPLPTAPIPATQQIEALQQAAMESKAANRKSAAAG